MIIIDRGSLDVAPREGRLVQRAIGPSGCIVSDALRMGFAVYSSGSGPSSLHRHDEDEVLVVLAAHDGWVRSGPSESDLGAPMALSRDTVVHISGGEWHVVECGAEGFVDVLYIHAPAGSGSMASHVRQEGHE